MKKHFENALVVILFLVIFFFATEPIILAPRDITTFSFKTHIGHSWDYNIWRIVGLAYSFVEGHSGRWIESFYFGWGYPLFEFTGSLPYALGAVLFIFGMEVNAALNLLWLFSFFVSGLAMLFVASKIFGRAGGLLTATCYLFSPYHFVDIYVRTNLGEFTSFCYPPLLLYAFFVADKKPRQAVILGAITISLLVHTHLLSMLLLVSSIIPFLLIYSFLLGKTTKWRVLGIGGLSIFLGLSLAGSFLLPAIADLKLVQGSTTLTSGYSNYENHFVFPHQLVNHYWGYGLSLEGERDEMSFTLGKTIVITACIALILSIFSYFLLAKKKLTAREALSKEKKILSLLIAAGVSAGLSTMMTLSWSKPVWEGLPKLAVVQFPWRFLFPASFYLSVCLGGLPFLLSFLLKRLSKLELLIAVVCSGVLVFVHHDFARVNSYEFASQKEIQVAAIKKRGVSTTNDADFFPKSAPFQPNTQPPNSAEVWDGYQRIENRIKSSSVKNGWARIELTAGPSGELVFYQLWYPAWKARINNKEIPIHLFTIHPHAPMAIPVGKDACIVEFSYELTRAGWWGRLLTSVAFASLILSAFLLTETPVVASREARPPGEAKQSRTLVNYLRLLRFARNDRKGPFIWLEALSVLVCIVGIIFVTWFTVENLPSLLISHIQTKNAPEVSARQILPYLDASAQQLSEAQVGSRKRSGTPWEAPGNYLLTPSGIRIQLSKIRYDRKIELSSDNNDYYTILLLRNDEIIAKKIVSPPSGDHWGLFVHKIEFSKEESSTGYDALVVLPFQGDGSYSIGHILFGDSFT